MIRERWYLLVAPLLLAAFAGCDPGKGEARGLARYNNCVPCHGEDGAGNRELGAPPIAGLPAWYVESQLRKFRDGTRGTPMDEPGLRMRSMARTLGEEDIQAVAGVVEHMKKVPAAPAYPGDAAHGKTLFLTCVACHGEQADGKKDQNAPALKQMSGWYLLGQLKKFKDGVRGAAPGDATGAQMRAAAATLSDEAAMKDVIAYISTLEK